MDYLDSTQCLALVATPGDRDDFCKAVAAALFHQQSADRAELAAAEEISRELDLQLQKL